MRKLRFVLTRLLGLLLVALLLLASHLASAHPMPTSRVLLDLQAQGGAAEVQLAALERAAAGPGQ